jgi:hypothetical protein
MKSSDAAFTNTQILGHSAAKFVIYRVTEYNRCAPDNVSTLVGMDILGHSAEFPKLPRIKFFTQMWSGGYTLFLLMKHGTSGISQHRSVPTSDKEGAGVPFGGNMVLQCSFPPPFFHMREFCIGEKEIQRRMQPTML